MFRILIAITSLLAVFGFAPSARMARSASLQMISPSEIGALPPVGFWDPLG